MSTIVAMNFFGARSKVAELRERLAADSKKLPQRLLKPMKPEGPLRLRNEKPTRNWYLNIVHDDVSFFL